jgi:hypothetical protein
MDWNALRQRCAVGQYDKWTGNDEFEKSCLRAVGLPEDFHPTEEEAFFIVQAALDTD